jgi:hypothetical protein
VGYSREAARGFGFLGKLNFVGRLMNFFYSPETVRIGED